MQQTYNAVYTPENLKYLVDGDVFVIIIRCLPRQDRALLQGVSKSWYNVVIPRCLDALSVHKDIVFSIINKKNNQLYKFTLPYSLPSSSNLTIMRLSQHIPYDA